MFFSIWIGDSCEVDFLGEIADNANDETDEVEDVDVEDSCKLLGRNACTFEMLHDSERRDADAMESFILLRDQL